MHDEIYSTIFGCLSESAFLQQGDWFGEKCLALQLAKPPCCRLPTWRVAESVAQVVCSVSIPQTREHKLLVDSSATSALVARGREWPATGVRRPAGKMLDFGDDPPEWWAVQGGFRPQQAKTN